MRQKLIIERIDYRSVNVYNNPGNIKAKKNESNSLQENTF